MQVYLNKMKNRGKNFCKILLHCVLPLVIGFIIYLSGRNDTLLNKHLNIAFHYSVPHSWWFNIFRFNLPDFCWDYSFSSALFLWGKMIIAKIKYFPFAVLFLLIASEAIQIFFRSFTFDWLDMLAAIFAFFLSCFVNYKK